MIKRKINTFINLQNLFKEYNRAAKVYWKKKTPNNIDREGLISLELSEYNPLELEVVQYGLNVCRLKYNYRASIILSSFKLKDLLFFQLFKSFNYSKIYWLFNLQKAFNFYFFQEIFASVKLFKTIESLDGICKLRYGEYLIGDLVYDTYIRLYDKSFVPKKDYTLFKLILKSVTAVNKYTSYFESNPNSKICISADKCYIYHGLFLRVGYKFQNDCYYYNGRILKKFNDTTESAHKHHPLLTQQELVNLFKGISLNDKLDEYFRNRFSGTINELDVYFAFKGKKSYSKEDVILNLELNRSKKNALIMPHAIKDFPHVTNCIFEDYYQWLLNILIIVKENNTVNWLIKPHPTSYLFGEIGVVEDLMNKLDVSNVKVLPKDFSTSAIPNLADIILTVSGTSGLEFACFGIPVINAGNSMYSNYGFNIEAKTKQEYYSILNSVDKIDRLSDEQITTAKHVAYYIFIHNHHTPTYIFDGYKKGQSYEHLFRNCINNYNDPNMKNELLESWIKKIF